MDRKLYELKRIRQEVKKLSLDKEDQEASKAPTTLAVVIFKFIDRFLNCILWVGAIIILMLAYKFLFG